MTGLRWTLGIVSGLMAAGACFSFVVFMLRDDNDWIVLARRFRRWTSALLLFWFNAEIWGRVVLTLAHW